MSRARLDRSTRGSLLILRLYTGTSYISVAISGYGCLDYAVRLTRHLSAERTDLILVCFDGRFAWSLGAPMTETDGVQKL